MANVVSAVHTLATSALKSGHKLHGEVLSPAQWATEAGFPGSKASALRQHIARQSNNGCSRKGRYPKVNAQGMLNLLKYGTEFGAAPKGSTKQSAAAKRTASMLAKARAGQSGAKQSSRTASRKSPTKSKAKVKA